MRWIEMAQKNEVYVEGTASTAPMITSVLKEEIPYVEFSLSEQRLRLHYPFKVNDVVRIDCLTQKVWINEQLQMETIDLVYADFFHLNPGQNEIKTIPAMQLEVMYTERWL
ncbi:MULTISPECIES: phage tail domain-containing protein [Clostridia]|uniref:phage distal tail protein n=1 Tax=Clostridia TaxID=186801 RepID=UPI000EA13FCF|nr:MULTISPECIES: phage tail domain-containing protein [Clostridia]NBJ70618.1 hypothetical protein [Roseburia sp. 1XD42-34]RKI76617.1 hypothetical protein D7V87_12990 [Clostridium sp. 1xD42-85]